MTGIQESAWLFTRGSESVRLVREENSNGCRLFLYGPAAEIVTHEFADLTECMKRQAEIERNLLVAGYRLEQSSSDRRTDDPAWRGPDHRRNGNDRDASDMQLKTADLNGRP